MQGFEMNEEFREAVALSVVEAGAKMIIEAVTRTKIREEAVDYQCRFHVESMIRELRRVMPVIETKPTKPIQCKCGE